jgi:NAD(P) transhydrogenase subunit alpha
MLIGIVKESLSGENRVAASPPMVEKLINLGYQVIVQSGAGSKSSINDSDFAAAGAQITKQAEDCWQADILLKVNAPTLDEVELMKSGATLISFIQPAQQPELLTALADKNINTLAMDMVPRMSRSQAFDALSAMANIAGYRAVIEASHHFGRFLSGQITAAGNIPPAKVLVIGAGVAGLAAIGTANSLGAIVRAFDTRAEVKEQIESMGAEFLELDFKEPEDAAREDGYAKEMSQAFIDAEMALFAQQASEVDIIITTAMIPGKQSPLLITKDMVELMKPGSVIVDLAAAGGGNCELTTPGKVRKIHGVKIIGYTDLVSRLPSQATQLYANNLYNLLKLLTPNADGQLSLDQTDDVIRHMTVVYHSAITFPPPPIKVSASPKPTQPQKMAQPLPKEPIPQTTGLLSKILLLALAISFVLISSNAPESFLSHLTVFALSCVIGYHVVWNVSHSLHTPLMSVTNAISGIIIIGAVLQISSDNFWIQSFAFVAILIASINIFGGFVVTDRMLKMFKK